MTAPHRVAAIDCGTNSVRLLVAEASDAGFTELARDLRITRLGRAWTPPVNSTRTH